MSFNGKEAANKIIDQYQWDPKEPPLHKVLETVLEVEVTKATQAANDVIRKQNLELMQFHNKQAAADALAKAAKAVLHHEDVCQALYGECGEACLKPFREALAAYTALRRAQDGRDKFIDLEDWKV